MRTFRLANTEGFKDINSFLIYLEPQVIEQIKVLISNEDLKINFRLFCKFERHTGNFIVESKCFKTRDEAILNSTDLSEMFRRVMNKLKKEASEFEQKESGWKLVEIEYLELRTNRYNPLRASSHIPLSENIKLKHAIINVCNEDDMCFK